MGNLEAPIPSVKKHAKNRRKRKIERNGKQILLRVLTKIPQKNRKNKAEKILPITHRVQLLY